jgi:aromatic ring-opening dioxygenase catalytic subunit (LigB family)
MEKVNILYLSHGGGPLPILGDPGHAAMVRFMQDLPSRLVRPEMILVISAHWEEAQPMLLSDSDAPLFYDYTGFPAAAYDITYPAPASHEWVRKMSALLSGAGFKPTVHPHRGLDHGVFIPLKMMVPEADIPVVQLSLIAGLDPAAHLALGKALRGLPAENLLVVGSGFSFHNLNAFFAPDAEKRDPANDAFQDWLVETVTGDMPQDTREQRLLQWESAPHARYCHPRAEHLLPLHVCAGMADRAGEKIFDDRIMGKRGVAFRW